MFATDLQISGGKGGSHSLVAAGSAWTSAGEGSSGVPEGGNVGGGLGRGKGADAMNWRSAAVGSRSPPSSSNCSALGGLESGSKGGIGSWDQFAANEKKFNVRANYDENMYTTKLDVDNIDSEKRRKAERIAREIEGTVSANIHVAEERNQQIQTDCDEEDLYSGVLTEDLKVRALKEKESDADGGKPLNENAVAGKEEKATEPAEDLPKESEEKETEHFE